MIAHNELCVAARLYYKFRFWLACVFWPWFQVYFLCRRIVRCRDMGFEVRMTDAKIFVEVTDDSTQ